MSSTTIINNTTTTNIRAKKISQLDILDREGIKDLADKLYLPVACVYGNESNTNYRIPISVILDMINDSGCKCMNNLENKFLALLAANVDFTWHTIDKVPKLISLGIDEKTKKIKIRLSDGVGPKPVTNTYKVILNLNTPINSDVNITGYDIQKENNKCLGEFALTSYIVELEVDEGVNIGFNIYWLCSYIKKCYPNSHIKLTDTYNGTIHDIIEDIENYEAWTKPIQIYKNEEIIIDAYISLYITYNNSNGINDFILNGKHIPVMDIDNQYILYSGTDNSLQCIPNEGYYIDGIDTITLNKDKVEHKFNVYQKPYVKFFIVAFNGNIYDGTSKCSELPQSLITNIQSNNGFYNINTKIDNIITDDIKSTLCHGGFYTLYNPLYYVKDTLNIINEIGKENKDIDIVLKQNTSVVNINITDGNAISSEQKLPLKRVINYETLFSTESPWDTSSIRCTIDPDLYTWNIKYTDSNNKSCKTKIEEILEISQTSKEFIFKFKDSPATTPDKKNAYNIFCSYVNTFNISIGVNIIEKYYYFAGWKLPNTISELISMAKSPNGGSVKSLIEYNKDNPLVNYIQNPISYSSKSTYYVVIPNELKIYSNDNVDVTSVAFTINKDVSIEGYTIYVSVSKSRNINAIKIF